MGSVLIWSGEDDPRDTLVPRLIACGADLSRIHFVGSVTEEDGIRAFDPARDADLLRDQACDRHASRLAGANPAMALGRREHVGEGKGARRNSPCTLRTRRLARPLPEGSQ